MKWPTLALAVALLTACQGEVGEAAGDLDDREPEVPQMGPVDGLDLPPTELERVAVGDPAPLFTLDGYDGETVSLVDFRGDKNVVLVFYRGHW